MLGSLLNSKHLDQYLTLCRCQGARIKDTSHCSQGQLCPKWHAVAGRMGAREGRTNRVWWGTVEGKVFTELLIVLDV